MTNTWEEVPLACDPFFCALFRMECTILSHSIGSRSNLGRQVTFPTKMRQAVEYWVRWKTFQESQALGEWSRGAPLLKAITQPIPAHCLFLPVHGAHRWAGAHSLGGPSTEETGEHSRLKIQLFFLYFFFLFFFFPLSAPASWLPWLHKYFCWHLCYCHVKMSFEKWEASRRGRPAAAPRSCPHNAGGSPSSSARPAPHCWPDHCSGEQRGKRLPLSLLWEKILKKNLKRKTLCYWQGSWGLCPQPCWFFPIQVLWEAIES